MASEPITTKLGTPTTDRRVHLRRKVTDLAYVACGPDNGGILVDLSEGGLSFQGVGNLTDGVILELRFLLSGISRPIEASGQVVWSTESKRGGGLRFVNLEDGVRQQIVHWVSARAASPDHKGQPGGDLNISAEPAAAGEPLQIAGILAIPVPAASPSENVRPASPEPDLRAVTSGTGGEEVLPAPGPRTMFADGLRRIHSVATPPRDATPVRAAIEVPAVQESAHQKIVLSGVPERSSNGVMYVLGIALGCVILLAGLIGFRTLRTSGGAEAGGGAVLAPEQSAGGANQNFQVEVVDIRNRRLILSDGAAGGATGASVTPDQAVVRRSPQTAAPPGGATVPVNPIQTQTNAQTSRSLQDLTLQGPRRVDRPASLAAPQALSVANLAPSIPPLDSSFLSPQSSNQPRPPQSSGELMRLRAGLQEAVLIKRIAPTYSIAARQARVAGTVQVSATIGTDGVPRALRVVSGDAKLAASALTAIQMWRYKPAQLDGQPIQSETVIRVEFQLK